MTPIDNPNLDPRLKFEAVTDCLCGSPVADGPVWGWGVCPSCGTWVNTRRPTRDVQHVVYGEAYWTVTQQLAGCPPLETRFETDMADRMPGYLDALAHLAPGSSVAEVGCGNARLLHELRAKGHRVVGTEYSQPVIDRVRKLTDVEIRLGGADRLDPGAYDAVISIDVLEHLHDPLAHLRELAALAKPSGTVMLHTPVISSPTEPYYYSVGMMWKLYHLHLFSRPLMERLVAAAGLVIVDDTRRLFGWPVLLLHRKAG